MSIDLAPLLNVGAVGVVTAYLLLRMDGLLRDMTKSIDRLALAIALETATRPGIPEQTRKTANDIVSSVQTAQAKAGAP